MSSAHRQTTVAQLDVELPVCNMSTAAQAIVGANKALELRSTAASTKQSAGRSLSAATRFIGLLRSKLFVNDRERSQRRHTRQPITAQTTAIKATGL
jgi:hypothetical protein